MILYGASGHSKVVLDILFKNEIVVDVIIDDSPQCEKIFGVSVVTSNTVDSQKKAIISIGNNEIRKKITQQYNFDFVNAIHPAATVSSFAKIGFGNVVMANAVINPDAEIGNHCIVNTGAVVEHDCKIEDFVHLSPNSSLGGNVSVAEGSHIGIGACVIQGTKVGKWAIIGAGAVIIRDVPDFATVVGNPGKIIKINKNNIH